MKLSYFEYVPKAAFDFTLIAGSSLYGPARVNSILTAV